MTTNHTPGPVFISPDQVHELNEKHGWFRFGDAQSDVSNAFANEAIARYERIRSAAPELLEALETVVAEWDALYPSFPTDAKIEDAEFSGFQMARAAIAKAKGERQ
ncbi:hypothetical protein PVB08_22410 [Bacillus thuringiensis]